MGRTLEAVGSPEFLLEKYDRLRVKYEKKKEEGVQFLEEAVELHMKVREQSQRIHELEQATRHLLIYKNSCITTFAYLQGRLSLASLNHEISDGLYETIMKITRDAVDSASIIEQNPTVERIVQGAMQDGNDATTAEQPPPPGLQYSDPSSLRTLSHGSFARPDTDEEDEAQSFETIWHRATQLRTQAEEGLNNTPAEQAVEEQAQHSS
ncbi:hypothetical protein AAVH_27175, partial [Aphelenchoides avenae]